MPIVSMCGRSWVYKTIVLLGILPSRVFCEGSTAFISPIGSFVCSSWQGGVSQKGALYGVQGGYSYFSSDHLYVAGDFLYAAGVLRGSAGVNPTQEYITQAFLGYAWGAFSDAFVCAPFVGAGSYLFSQTFFGEANFTSRFWYVPIGVTFSYALSSSWSVGGEVYGAPTFGGWWKVHQGRSALTRPLWYGQMKLAYHKGTSWEFSLLPFYKQWAYRETGDLLSQSNQYYGCKGQIGYCF